MNSTPYGFLPHSAMRYLDYCCKFHEQYYRNVDGVGVQGQLLNSGRGQLAHATEHIVGGCEQQAVEGSGPK